MLDNKEVKMIYIKKLADWLNKLHTAFREGTMTQALTEFPDYYREVDTKV